MIVYKEEPFYEEEPFYYKGENLADPEPFEGRSQGSYKCIGYGQTDCSYSDTPPATITISADRTYTAPWTATENGTGVSVRFFIGSSWYPIDAWVVLYRQDGGTGDWTLVGQAAIGTVTNEAWNDVELSAVSGQNLNFSTDDVLNFGYVVNPDSGNCAIGNNANSTEPLLDYLTDDISAGPASTVSAWTQSSTNQVAIMFKYLG